MKHYFRLMRPHQWVKNGFLYLPAFFAQRFTEWELLGDITLAVVAFSFIASSIYILNDYRDRADDRLHPRKKHRPLAAETVSVSIALSLMVVLFLLGTGVLYFLGIDCMLLGLTYVIINILYSFILKHVPIIDLYVIAAGFVIRIGLGAAVGDIPLSMWIILMTFLLAIFIGLAKRREDVVLAGEGKKVRKSIDGYNLPFINGAMMIMASVLIVSYISYTISPDTQNKFGNPYLYITVFFVILGILRYMQITFVEERSGNPTEMLLKDLFLQLTIICWIASFVILIYL